MYSPDLQMILAEARIEDLRRARVTLIRPDRSRDERSRRSAARWGLLTRAGLRRLVFAEPARATTGPRS
jgi:hypothetical protein